MATSTPPLAPRDNAILAEISQLSAAQSSTEQRQPPDSAPTDRRSAILNEVRGLAQSLPASRSQAIISEVQGIAARRNQDVISGGSFLEKALDTINTPQQFMFGLLTKEPQETLWESGVRGTKENTRFADVLERDFAADPNAISTKVLGFAGDVLLDPIIFAGKLKLGSKLIGVGREAIGLTAAKLAPEVSATLFETAVKPIARMFSKTAFASGAERDLLGIIDLELGRAQATAGRIFVEEAQQRKIATDLAKQFGIGEQQLLTDIARRVEVKTGSQLAFPFATFKESEKALAAPQLALFPGKGELGRDFAVIADRVAKVEAPLKALPAGAEREIALQVTSMKQRLENSLIREQSFGLKTTRLEDSTVDYLTHLVTPEAKKLLTSLPQFRTFGREFNAQHAFQLARVLDESNPAIRAAIEAGGSADIATINRLWSEGKLMPQLGNAAKLPEKLLFDDPYVLTAIRRVRGEKAIADAEVLMRSAGNRDLALPKGEAPAFFRPLRLPADARWDRLRDYLGKFSYEPDVAAHLEQTMETTLLPEGLDRFTKAFDTVQGVWKGLTLAPFPAYHLRNAVGNVWNNYLAGLTNPKYYADAMSVQMGTLREVSAAGKSIPLDAFKRMLEDFGITSGTFVEGETMRKTLPGMSRVYMSAEDLPVIGKAVSLGLRTGKAVEQNARIAHFMYQLDEGKSAMDAAMSVKKYLFDYSSGLTTFEQSVMRRIFPFYAWTRFNVPLQIEALVNNPRPFMRLAEVVNTVRSTGSPEFQSKSAGYRAKDEQLLGAYIQDNVGVPFRMAPNGEPEYFLLGGWLPAADLNVLGSKGGMIGKLTDMLSPLIKTPIQQLTNRDLYRDRELEEYSGQTERFLGAEVRRRHVEVLKNIRILAEADRIVKQFDGVQDPNDPEQSRLGAVTRLIFGLKAMPAQPDVEARRMMIEQRKRRGYLRGAIRQDLPNAAAMLSGDASDEQ